MKKHLLLCGLIFIPLLLLAQPKVIISELLYDTPLSETSGANRYNGEFVSIHNYGYSPVDISGWRLISDGAQQVFTFPEGSVMQPKAKFYVAYRNAQGNFSLADLYLGFKLRKNDREFYQRSITFANDGESLRLYRLDGAMQDSLYYDGTSNKRKVPRLEALNGDGVPGNQCISFQRCNVTLIDTTIIFNPLDYKDCLVALSKPAAAALQENGEPVSAQLSYAYDASGNRVGRTITIYPTPVSPFSATRVAGKAMGGISHSATAEKEQDETYYTDRLDKSDVVIYPNPTQGVLAVELRHANLEESYRLLVYNLSGTLVFQQSNISSYTSIDLSAQPRGIYIMRIWSSTSSVAWKILKE